MCSGSTAHQCRIPDLLIPSLEFFPGPQAASHENVREVVPLLWRSPYTSHLGQGWGKDGLEQGLSITILPVQVPGGEGSCSRAERPGDNQREREREGWGIMAEDIKVSVPGGLFLETLSEQGSTQVGTFQVSRCLDTDGDPGGESP